MSLRELIDNYGLIMSDACLKMSDGPLCSVYSGLSMCPAE